ncbi:hypothetical protein [Streptomyces sp. NPDC059994]|uniref:hypothetical protein n=1 Tax=Streptomyces sp. NPDC059994 TaxID=3347029 RepID=UPI0036988600
MLILLVRYSVLHSRSTSVSTGTRSYSISTWGGEAWAGGAVSVVSCLRNGPSGADSGRTGNGPWTTARSTACRSRAGRRSAYLNCRA